MSKAVFSSSVTYTPGGGGLLTQPFAVAAPYASVSAGTLATSPTQAADTALVIPFGGVGADARGLVVRNNTGVDLGIRLNGAAADLYHLADGGLVMHWAPAAAASAASALKSCTVTLATAPAANGSIEYLVFGA